MDILKLSDWLVKGALLFPQLVAQVVGKWMRCLKTVRFLQQKVVSELSRATRLRKEKSGDLVDTSSYDV